MTKFGVQKLIVLNLQSILARELSLGSRLDCQPRPLKYQEIKCAEIVEAVNVILLIFFNWILLGMNRLC